jgi:hypothetical protein
METIRVPLDVSRKLARVLDVPETDLGPHLKRLIALELVREEHLLPGRAAELLDLRPKEVTAVLDERGIDYVVEAPDEWAAQVEEVWRRLTNPSS